MVDFLDSFLSKCALVGHPLLFQHVIGHFKDKINCRTRSHFPAAGPISLEFFNHPGIFITVMGHTRNRSCGKYQEEIGKIGSLVIEV
jgi:hypothetical protein